MTSDEQTRTAPLELAASPAPRDERLEALRALSDAATRGPWRWAGYANGSIELRGEPHGQRVVTTMREDPCFADTAAYGVVLTATACEPCRAYDRQARESRDLERRTECAKPENLGTVWLNTPGEGYVQPANVWAVKEVPYRNDVVRVDHPDAQLIVAAVNYVRALLGEADTPPASEPPHGKTFASGTPPPGPGKTWASGGPAIDHTEDPL